MRFSLFWRVALFFVGITVLIPARHVSAGTLSRISDLISTSAPNATSTHIVQFSLGSNVPAGGKIVFGPTDGAYLLESGLNFNDLDFSVSSGGPFVDRSLAASASATDEGVQVLSDDIVIQLNSTTGLSAGDIIRITLGSDASFGSLGTHSPINPALSGSYRIRATTFDASDVPIDVGTTMIAIVQQVTIHVSATPQPPVRVNGLPSGLIAANNPNIEISLETNRPSTCRYSTTASTTYASMVNTFDSSGGTLFYTTITGHQNATSYTYYVRCIDNTGSPNTDDYPISFTLDVTPTSNTSIAQAGSSGHGGEGPFPEGSSVLYLASVTLSGSAPPGSLVTVLKDGVAYGTGSATSDGRFQITGDLLERGAYTFMTYAQDSSGLMTASYNATITLESGTQNKISDIILSPTLELPKSSVALGDNIIAQGSAAPGALVELFVTPQKGNTKVSEVKKYTATSSSMQSTRPGSWSVTIPGNSFSKGSFVVQARLRMGESGESNMSKPLLLGVGESAVAGTNRSDLNRDGKVNLVDFSILLSYWNTDDAVADINQDGGVNLADFSIMLFNWTG